MFIKEKVLSNAAIYTLSNFAVAGIPFILLPFLARVLSPEDYGIIAIYNIMLAFTTICVGLNAHGSLTVRYFDDPKYDMSEYVSSVLLIPFLTSIILFFIFFNFGTFILNLTGLPPGWLYTCILVYIGQFIIQVQLVLWQAMRRQKPYVPLLMNSLANAEFNKKKKIVQFTNVYFVVMFIIASAFAFIIPKLLHLITGAQFWQVLELLLFIFLGNALSGMNTW